MKKIGLCMCLLLFVAKMQAQSNELISDTFWKSLPDLTAVKAEVAKGFDFAHTVSMEDPIVYAIRNEAAPEIVTYLLSQPGVDVKKLIVEGRIYLHLAANAGQAAVVDALLDKGSDMYFLDGNGHTAFTFAGFQGHLTPEMIDVFIKHGIDLNKKYKSKEDANILLLAIPYDTDLHITDYLIAKGVSINSTDAHGYTAFDHAAKIGNVAQFKKLIQRGVKYTDNALLLASQGTYRSANTLETYTYLVEDLHINPKVTDQHGRNVLHSIAKKREQQDIVAYFLNKGVSVNQVDNEGNTPFMVAAGSRNWEVLEAMWAKVETNMINQKNKEGQTALWNAVASGEAETVALLLNNGADVKVVDIDGNSLVYPLLASYPVPRKGGRGFRGTTIEKERENFFEKLELLKKAGLDFSKKQQKGRTVFHLAASKNDVALLKSLVTLKVNINEKNDDGATALHIAAMSAENDTVLKYLLEHGADKRIATPFGDTAYSLATENEVLSKHNVSINFLK